MTESFGTFRGASARDRDSFLQAVALIEAVLVDDPDGADALTRHLGAADVAGLVTALLSLFEAAYRREQWAIVSLLEDTRRFNLEEAVGGSS